MTWGRHEKSAAGTGGALLWKLTPNFHPKKPWPVVLIYQIPVHCQRQIYKQQQCLKRCDLFSIIFIFYNASQDPLNWTLFLHNIRSLLFNPVWGGKYLCRVKVGIEEDVSFQAHYLLQRNWSCLIHSHLETASQVLFSASGPSQN